MTSRLREFGETAPAQSDLAEPCFTVEQVWRILYVFDAYAGEHTEVDEAIIEELETSIECLTK